MFEPLDVKNTPEHYAHYKVQLKGVSHYDMRQTQVWIRISVLNEQFQEIHVLLSTVKYYTNSPLTESIIRHLRDSTALFRYRKINPPTESVIFEIGNLAPFLIATGQIKFFNRYFRQSLTCMRRILKKNYIPKVTYRLIDKPEFNLDWVISRKPSYKSRPSLAELGIECRTWATRQIEAIKELYGQ